MQSLRNADFCAPTSFRAFASLRQAVRRACLAAASLSAAGAGAEAVVVLAATAAVGERPGSPGPTLARTRMKGASVTRAAVRSIEERTLCRIASGAGYGDEARMKLR
jgi:hypothetical protein